MSAKEPSGSQSTESEKRASLLTSATATEALRELARLAQRNTGAVTIVLLMFLSLLVVLAVVAFLVLNMPAPAERHPAEPPWRPEKPLQPLRAKRLPGTRDRRTERRPPGSSSAAESYTSHETAVSISYDVFCPELVVPHGHEAVLAVPKMVRQGRLDVKDTEGVAVIIADLNTSARGAMPVISLRAAAMQAKLLASCRLPSSGRVEILRGNGDRYGTLTGAEASQLQRIWKGDRRPSTGRCYLLSSEHGYLVFSGSFSTNEILVQNEFAERVAESEPEAKDVHVAGAFRFRVTSGMDVGLVLCGLLSIRVLELSQ